LPKLARFEFRRLYAVCLALRDFSKGVKGQPAEYGEAALVREYVNELDGGPPPRPAIVPRISTQQQLSS
jgi:hypothetical protein